MSATGDAGFSFQGSDGVLYHTTPADLKAKAGDIRNTQQVVQSELDNLQKYVLNLEAVWGGIAASTFQELMHQWDAHAAQLQEALLAIATGLDGTADNYVHSEHSNLKNLSRVQLPQARLS